jgi:hypothetical protein
MIRNLILTIMLVFLSACNVIPYFNPDERSYAENKEHFKQAITVYESGDMLVFSTIYGQQREQLPDSWDDNFMRGFIDKNTNQKIYQVYNIIYYAGHGRDDWRAYNQASYTIPDGQQLVPTKILKQHEDCNAINMYGKCVYSEHVTFTISEDLIRTIAQQAEDNTRWMYNLIPERGDLYPDAMQTSELAALVARMDSYPLTARGQQILSTDVQISPETPVITPSIGDKLPPERQIPNGKAVF